MKKFKDIRSRINEDHEYAIANAADVAHGRYQVDKKDPEVISRITQAVNHELDKGYMSPSTAINQLRTKLNFVGFDFDMKDVPSSGSVSFPLKSATEVFGRGMDIDKFDVDFDDQSAISTGLTLNVTISKNDDGLYKLNGKIN